MVTVPIQNMNKQFVTTIVSHNFNGNEVEVKTVEVDGKKFIADETDPTKPKLDDKQQPVPFVDTKVVPKIEDLSKADLAELAKVNPHVAKMLDDAKARTEADEKAAAEKKAADEKAAGEKGEWQKLADTRAQELEGTKGTLKQKEEMLGKYVETTEKVLKGLLATIPKENVSLIPADFSPRQKLEYIITNAARLGAKMNAVDGKIDKNDLTPNGTDEDKLMARMAELTTKANARTATTAELTELRQTGMKITELRREAAAKK